MLENLTAPIFGNTIPDNSIPRLNEIGSKGIKRPIGVSRYQLVMNPDGKGLSPDKRWHPEISEDEATQAKLICSNLIIHSFKMAEKLKSPLSKNDLVEIYDLATQKYGLSRLEAEELAPDNLAWLTMCLSPSREVVEMTGINMNAG